LVVDNIDGELCQDEANCGAVSRLDVDREPGAKYSFHGKHERILQSLRSSAGT